MREDQSETTVRIETLVVSAETNSARFEVFCRGVVSVIEGGAPILGTSRSWDMGRDGVGYGAAAGIYVCVSLRDDVDMKAYADVDRITATTPNIQKLYFCSSQELSEHRLDQIQAALRSHVGEKFPIVCLGAAQLVEASTAQLIERHYGAEIKNVLSRISLDSHDESELRGLRLALITSGAVEAHEVREEIYSATLLDILNTAQSGLTPVACAKAISDQLRLGRTLSTAPVALQLASLAALGFARGSEGIYSITDAGRAHIASKQVDAARELLVGRNSIKKALEEAIGSQIIDDEFNRIWNVFEERMAFYFQSRGDAIVAEISALLDDAEISAQTKHPFSFIEDFAEAVGSTSTHAQRKEELAQAIKDLFFDRSGVAAEWLVKVCAAYVTACTLGLENATAGAIAALLKRTTLVLDTDVVLSLLGEGEPEHDGVVQLVSAWRKLGGRILVSTSVLEEVAYHASIAQRDFEQVLQFLRSSEEERLQLIENVFVRSFSANLSRDPSIREKHWRAYIKQFVGSEEYDWTNVSGYLQDEYRIQRLPEHSSTFSQLISDVQTFLLERAQDVGKRVDKNLRDKAARDASLYADLVQYVAAQKSLDPTSTSLLVSSARRLGEVDGRFRRTGERHVVVSIASALYLVSLLPNVTLSLSAMKAFLFDESHKRFSSELERTVIRMIKVSTEFSLPFAKRAPLMREVRERLLSNAEYRAPGMASPSITELERKAVLPSNHAVFIDTLRSALDATAADSRAEVEVRRLKRENEDLREQLARQRTAKKTKK